MGKGVRDEIGVIVFEPELMDEAVACLEQDDRNRYFLSVHLDGGLIENNVVYGHSVRSILLCSINVDSAPFHELS